MSRYDTRNTNDIPQFKVKINFLWNSFFPSAVLEWNNLDLNIRNSESLNISKKILSKFIGPSRSSVLNCLNPTGVKLLTRLRLGLSHFRQHKLKHGFQDSLNPICSYHNCKRNDSETSAYFLPHCPHHPNERLTFLNNIRNINRNILHEIDLQIIETLLDGNSFLNDKSITLILNATIDYLFVTDAFDVNLL